MYELKKVINKKEIAIIKSYKNTNRMKMTICRKPDKFYKKYDPFKKPVEKGSINDEKLQCNLSRAKNAVYELAMCNPWEYFGNFTMDSKKHDRFDLKGYYRKFSQWIRDYNKKYNISIKYLFIPEKHKDGAWHMHGFLFGIPLDHLTPFKEGDLTESGKPIPRDLWENGYLNWVAYMKKFGWNSFGIIGNHEAISKYITKYISKDLNESVQEVNAKSYYCSRGLEKATEVSRGYLAVSIKDSSCDFVNDYVRVINFDGNDLNHYLGSIISYDDELSKSS